MPDTWYKLFFQMYSYISNLVGIFFSLFAFLLKVGSANPSAGFIQMQSTLSGIFKSFLKASSHGQRSLVRLW